LRLYNTKFISKAVIYNNSRASRNILFISETSILVYKSGRDIGYNSKESSKGSNSNIKILKIIGSRYLFLVRVIKPNRISLLIRSSLATNKFLFI
jgi:hypothetical protein